MNAPFLDPTINPDAEARVWAAVEAWRGMQPADALVQQDSPANFLLHLDQALTMDASFGEFPDEEPVPYHLSPEDRLVLEALQRRMPSDMHTIYNQRLDNGLGPA